MLCTSEVWRALDVREPPALPSSLTPQGAAAWLLDETQATDGSAVVVAIYTGR